MKVKHLITNFKILKNFDMVNSCFIERKAVFMELVNKVAPLKSKYLKAIYSKFMTKELRSSEAKLKYNKQKNLCVSLFRKA